MKAHKHSELINTWLANQDVVGFQGEVYGEWKPVSLNCVIFEPERYAYRIDPDCRYAIEKIRELGGDEAVELYQYWLGGGILQGEVFKCTTVEDFLPPSCDPFHEFKGIISCYNVRKKKQTVKQVLWVSRPPFKAPDLIKRPMDCMETSRLIDEMIESMSDNDFAMSCWMDDGMELSNGKWHKVPTCTREVEV